MKIQPAEGEYYTMKKTFREQVKYYKRQSLTAQELIGELKNE